MSKTQKFHVVRSHQGDRAYLEGEVREGTIAEFAHLIPYVLRPLADAEKAEPEVENKAEPAVANKAEPRRKSK